MSSSKSGMSRSIMSDPGGLGSFLDRLELVHDVAAHNAGRQRSGLRQTLAAAEKAGHELGYASGYASGEAKGYQAGCERGEEKVRQEIIAAEGDRLQAFADLLDRLSAEAEASVQRWTEEAADHYAVLAIEIARRALGKELEAAPDTVVEIAKTVLAEVTEGASVRVRINPTQTAILESHRAELESRASHIHNLEIIPDHHVDGGCMVESDGGVIDARIQTYLQRLAESMWGENAS